MKILRKNDDWNKINTREELLELLKIILMLVMMIGKFYQN